MMVFCVDETHVSRAHAARKRGRNGIGASRGERCGAVWRERSMAGLLRGEEVGDATSGASGFHVEGGKQQPQPRQV